MDYKIKEIHFSLNDNQLNINSQPIQANQKTYAAILYLLSSENEVVKKNELMAQVWQGVIVSDDSLFKQIQLIRKIFNSAGLPDDTIENVYGKGYRIKYAISKIETTEGQYSRVKKGLNIPFYVYLLPIITIVLAVVFWSVFKQTRSMDLLDQEERKSIHNLMTQDWDEGLANIKQILASTDQNYSKSDLAYLYSKKGVAEYRLQKFQDSFSSLTRALELNTELNDLNMIGENHLNLAKYYDFNKDNQNQSKHIKLSIDYFKQAGSDTSVIDAQMELAYIQKKSGDIKLAIATYQNIIEQAKQINDKTGEMIAINNLAATHLIINEYDQALALAEAGLALNLELGNGQHIANSYSFLSQLYQQQLSTSKALSMIEQAIKYQLNSGDFRNMSPKLMTLNYLLVQTFQYQRASELLAITDQYAEALKVKNSSAIINLYQGMNAAHQNLWSIAEAHLIQAYQLSEKNNFRYKQDETIAYLALAYYFNNNHLQALEPALKVVNDAKSNDRPKALAALVLAYTYRHIERQTLFDQWYLKAEESIKPEWLFEYQLLTQLRSEMAQDSTSISQSQTQIEYQNIQKKMLALAVTSQMNEGIYTELKTKVMEQIDSIKSDSESSSP